MSWKQQNFIRKMNLLQRNRFRMKLLKVLNLHERFFKRLSSVLVRDKDFYGIGHAIEEEIQLNRD